MKNTRKLVISLLSIGVCAVLGQSSLAANEVLVQALKDEMQRSLSELQIDDEPKPYFIAYTVDEVAIDMVQSILGAVADTNHATSRNLAVTVRVGDRKLDNTNFGGGGGLLGGLMGGMMGGGAFPLTDSYDELRRIIWMRTDSAYKDAVSSLAAKKTALEQQPGLERAHDFSTEESFEYVSERQITTVDNERLVTFANELSATLKGYPELQQTATTVSYTTSVRTYIDSDDNFHRLVSSFCSVRTQASGQADDGAPVRDSVTAFSGNCEDLYEQKEVVRQRHAELIARIQEFMGAEHIKAYTGPVLFTEEASASFFSQVFGSLAGASPEPVSEVGGFNMLGGMKNPFLDRLGKRVLPTFLSLVNDPTQREYEGVALLGSYVVDSEGMPSRRTQLITEGKLDTLLTTRSPVETLDKSTGSNRLGTPLPGNLFVTSTESLTEEELKAELLAWVEDSGNDYGIIIKRFDDLESIVMSGSFEMLFALTQSAALGGIPFLPTLQAYKIDLEGNETPIRSLTVQSFSDRQLRDIIAVSATTRAYNVTTPFSAATMISVLGGMGGGTGALSTPAFIGVVAPAVLLEEMTLQGGTTGHPRLPIVSHPAKN